MGVGLGWGKTSAEPNNRYQGLPRLCLYLPNGKQSPWENSGELNTLVKHEATESYYVLRNPARVPEPLQKLIK